MALFQGTFHDAPNPRPALDQCSDRLASLGWGYHVIRPSNGQARNRSRRPHGTLCPSLTKETNSGHRAGILGTTESDICISICRIVVVPVRRTEIRRFIVPGAAPKDCVTCGPIPRAASHAAQLTCSSNVSRNRFVSAWAAWAIQLCTRRVASSCFITPVSTAVCRP